MQNSSHSPVASVAAAQGVPTQSSPTQSLERSFLLLGLVASAESDLGVSELARRSGLAKSTTARLLRSLRDLGALEVTPGGGHRIGPTIGALIAGRPGSPDLLRQLARPILSDLAELLGEHTTLAITSGTNAEYLDQVSSPSAVDVGDWTGEVHPAHASASGQVLMADWPRGRVDRYIKGGLVALTEFTVADPALLLERLSMVEDEGLAWSVDEFLEDVSGCAAPVFDAEGAVVASVGAFAPSYRFPTELGAERTGELIRAAAADLSALLAE